MMLTYRALYFFLPVLFIATVALADAANAELPFLKDNVIIRSEDRFCGAYVAWHALNYYDKKSSIEELVAQLSLSVEEGCSIVDVGTLLKSKNISTTYVTVPLNELSKVQQPFIAYLKPREGKIGHLLFCVPLKDEFMLVADGTRIRRIELWRFKQIGNWDGTVMLLPAAASSLSLNPLLVGGAIGFGTITLGQLTKLFKKRKALS